jgi:hypothetical protein
MGLRGSNERTPGDKTEQGVTTVSYLLIFVVFSCSIALAWSVPTRSDVSGLAAGLTAFALSGAAAAVGAGLGFLFGLPRLRDTHRVPPVPPTQTQEATGRRIVSSVSAGAECGADQRATC